MALVGDPSPLAGKSKQTIMRGAAAAKHVPAIYTMALRHSATATFEAVDKYDVGNFVELTIVGDAESGTRESVTVQLTLGDIDHMVNLLRASQREVLAMEPWNA